MSDPALWAKVHEIDKSLASHLAQCAEQNVHVGRELRSVKKVLWATFTSAFGLLVVICGVLLKNHLHL